MIKHRNKKGKEADMENEVLTEENHTALNIVHQDSFLLSPSVTLVHLTLAKLAVIGVVEDNLNFNELKNRQHSCTFLKNLKHYLHTIPDDCKEGLEGTRYSSR